MKTLESSLFLFSRKPIDSKSNSNLQDIFDGISGKSDNYSTESNSKRCVVEKWVFLPHLDFERLKVNLYQE